MARVQMPALRDRREDIPLLVEAFVAELGREHRRRVTGVTRGVLERLVRHDWPGNLGELRNTLEGMVVFAEGRRPLDLSDLPDRLRGADDEAGRIELVAGTTLEGAERALITVTLRHTGNDKTRAADMLGMGLRTLYRKLKRYSIR
jgi:DNA-binding NtrC family response regulator